MNNLEKEIYELELSLLKPDIRLSEKQLDILLHDEFREFGSSGKEYDKKYVLERLPQSTPPVYVVSDFNLKQLSNDLILTTFKTERTDKENNKVISLRSSTWKHDDGRWQMIFHQGTPINFE